MAPISIGEIHVPGGSGLISARAVTLTSPPQASGGLELFFAMFAAETPKRVIEKLCDRLTEELRPVYFQKGDAEARFESALKQANKSILAFLYEHGLSMPGIKLRGSVAALTDGKLFVSSRGQMRGVLFVPQARALAPYTLFDETPDKQGDPKFFTSLQAGAFPDGGRLVIATSELFQALDESFVRGALGQPDFAKASRDVKAALRNARLPVSILSLSSPAPDGVLAAEPEEASAVPAPPKPIPPRSRGAAPIVGPDIGELLARALRAALLFTGRILASAARAVWSVLKGVVLLPLRLPRAVAVLADREARSRLVANCVSAPDRCVAAGVERLNALPAASRAHFFLLLAVGAVFLHGIFFSFRRELGLREAKAYEASLTELQRLESDFESGLIYDNEDRNRELLSRMAALAASLPEETAAQQKNKADALAAVESDRDKLRRIAVVEKPAVFASVDEEGFAAAAMGWFQDKLYVFSSESGRVHVFSSEGAPSSDPEIAAMPHGIVAAAAARTGFLLEDASGRVAFWNPETDETVEYPETLSGSAPILFYQGRLYDAGADGTVSRRGVASKSLGDPSDALRGAPASPTGLAADGALYLLYRDGSTRKFLKGASVQEYAPTAIDPAPADATGLWASADSNKLAFADRGGDRAYLVDKTTGRLLSQLTAPEFAGLRAAAVDDGGRAVYLATASGRIYAVPIK